MGAQGAYQPRTAVSGPGSSRLAWLGVFFLGMLGVMVYKFRACPGRRGAVKRPWRFSM
jgi:hypothetical protein